MKMIKISKKDLLGILFTRLSVFRKIYKSYHKDCVQHEHLRKHYKEVRSKYRNKVKRTIWNIKFINQIPYRLHSSSDIFNIVTFNSLLGSSDEF